MALLPLSADTAVVDSWQTKQNRDHTLVTADAVASRLPELLIAADRIASTIVSGQHGRRRVGTGENFWQFRQFNSGDNSTRVDWRRSARSDAMFVREHEWDTPQVVWLWCDLSMSMRVRSSLVEHSKLERALLLLFAAARLLTNAGERVGLLGLSRPVVGRHAPYLLAEHLARHLGATSAPDNALPRVDLQRNSDVLLFSDFITDSPDLHPGIAQLDAAGTRGHLIQLLDPLEQTFPFRGRLEFQDPETGERLIAGKAQDWGERYRQLIFALQDELKDTCRRRGWTYLLHHTDKPAAAALLNLHLDLTGQPANTGAL